MAFYDTPKGAGKKKNPPRTHPIEIPDYPRSLYGGKGGGRGVIGVVQAPKAVRRETHITLTCSEAAS